MHLAAKVFILFYESKLFFKTKSSLCSVLSPSSSWSVTFIQTSQARVLETFSPKGKYLLLLVKIQPAYLYFLLRVKKFMIHTHSWSHIALHFLYLPQKCHLFVWLLFLYMFWSKWGEKITDSEKSNFKFIFLSGIFPPRFPIQVH